jgi:hypothetical protein
MPLITRQGKGTKLTIQEMDGNLIYLENLASIGITGGTGPIGPQGATGPFRLPGSIRNDAFTGSTITINHGYGYYPMVQIINDEGELIVPDNITHSSVNSYTVDFGVTVSGTIITGVSDGLRFTGGGTAISFGSSDIHAWGNIIPTSNDTYNLGSSESRWNNLYVKDIFAASQSLYLGTVKLADNDGELVIEKSVDGGAISTISLSVDTKYLEGVSISQNSSLILKSPTTTIYGMTVGAPLPSPNQFFIQVTGENLNGDPTEIAFLISKTDAYGDRTLWWDDTLPPAPQYFVVPIPKHSSKKVSGASPQSSLFFQVPIPKHSSGGGTLKRSSYSTKKLKFTGVSSNDTTKNVSYEYPILSVELLDGDTGYVVWCPIAAGAIPQIYQDLNYSFSVLETSEEISKSKLYSRTDSIDWADSGYNDPTGFDYQIDGSSISVSFNFKGATAPWIYDVKSLVKFRDVALTIRDTTNDDNQIDLIVTNVEDDTVSGSGGIVEFTRIDGRITNLPVGASFSFDSNSAIEYKPIETKFIESVSTSQNSSLLVKSPTTTIYGMTVGAPLPSPNQFYIQVTGENLNGDPTEIAFLISKTDAIGDRTLWWDDTLPPAPQHFQVPIPKHSSKKVSGASPQSSPHVQVPIPKHSSGGGTLKRSSYSTKKLKFTGVSSNDTTKNVSYEYPILSVDLLDSDVGPGVTDAGYVVWCPIAAGAIPQIYQDLNYSFSVLETSEEISKSKLYSRTDSIDWADSGYNDPTGFDYQIDGSSISVSFNFKGATAPWIYDVKSLVKFRDVALTIRDTTNDDNQIDLIVTNVEDDTVSGSGGIVEFTRIDGRITNLPIGASFSFDSNSAIEYKPIETKFIESVSTSQNSSLLVKSPTTTIYGMNVGAPLPSPNQFFIQVTGENLNGDPTEIAFLISKTDAIGDRSIWWDDTLPPAPQYVVVPIPKHSSKKIPQSSPFVQVPIPKHSSGGGTLKRSSYSTKKLKFTGVSSNDTSKNLSYEYPILSVELLDGDTGYVVWCPIAAGAIPQIYQDLNYSFSILETSEEISKSKLYSRTDSIDWADSGFNNPTGYDYQIDGSSISVSFNFKGATAPWIYDVKSLVKFRDVALTIRDTTNDDNQIDLIVTNVEDDTVSGSGGIVEFTRIDGRITNLPVGASFSFDSNSTIEYKPIETKFIESVSTSQNSSLLVKSPTPTIYGMNVGAPLPSPNQFFIQITSENLNGDPTEIAFLISKTDAIGDRSIWWDDTLPPAPQLFQVPVPKHTTKKVSGATPPTSQIFIVPIPKHSSGGGTLKRSSYSTKKLKFTGVSSNDTSKNLSYEYPILSVELLADDSGYVVWCPIAAGNVPQIYQDLNYSFSILETSDEISKSKLYSRTDSIDWADSGFNNPTGYDYQIDGSSISVSFNFKGATAPWIYDVKSLVKFRDVALTIRDTTNDDNQIDLIVTNVEDDTVSGSGGIVEFTRIDGRITNLPVGASFSFDSNSTIEYKPIETKFIESVSTSQNSSLLVKSPTTTIYQLGDAAPVPSSNQFYIQVTSENLNGDPTEIAFLISKTDAIGDRSIWWDDTLPPAPQYVQVPVPKHTSKGGTRKRSTYSTKKLKFTGVSSTDTSKNLSYEYPILSVELLDSDAGLGVTDAGYIVWCSINPGATPQIYQDLNYSFSILETTKEISNSQLYQRTDSIDWADSGYNDPTGFDYQIDGSSISVSFNFKGATAPWIYDVKSLTKYRDVALTIRDTDNDDNQIDLIVTNVEDDTVSGSGGIVEFTRIDGRITNLPIGASFSFDSNSTIEYKPIETKFIESVSTSQNSSLLFKSPTTTIYQMGAEAPLPKDNEFFIQITDENSNGDPKEIAFILPKKDAVGDRTIWWDDLLPPSPYFVWVPVPRHGSVSQSKRISTYSNKKLRFTGVSSNDTAKNISYEYPILSVYPSHNDEGYIVWCSIKVGDVPQIYQDLNYSFSILETTPDVSTNKLYQRTDSIDWADSGFNNPTGFDYQIDGSSISVSFNFKGATAPWIYDVKSLIKYRDVALTIRDTDNDDSQIDFIVTNVEDDTVSGSGGIVEFTRIDGIISSLSINGWTFGATSLSFDSNSTIEYKALDPISSALKLSNGFVQSEYPLILGPVTNAGGPRSGIIKLKPRGTKDLSIGVGPITSTASGQTVSMVEVLGDGLISNTFILGDWTDPVTNAGGPRNGTIKLKPKGSKDLSIGVGPIGSTAGGETFSAVEVYGDGLVSNAYLFGSWIDSDGDIDTGFGATGSTASGTTFSAVEVIGSGIISDRFFIKNPLGPVTNAGGSRGGLIKLKPKGSKDLSIGFGPISFTASGETYSIIDVRGDGLISNRFILGDWTDPVTNSGGLRGGLIKLKPKGSKDLSIGVGAIGSTSSGETFSAVEVYGDGLVSNTYLFGSWIDSDGDIDTGFGATGSTASGTTFSAVEVFGDGVISNTFFLNNPLDPVTNAGGPRRGFIKLKPKGSKDLRPIGVGPITSTASGQTVSMVDVLGDGIISNTFILGDWTDPVTNAGGPRGGLIKLKPKGSKDLSIGVGAIGSTSSGETFSAVEVYGDGLVSNTYLFGSWIDSDGDIDTGFGATGSTASGTTQSFVEVFGDGLVSQSLVIGNLDDGITMNRYDGILTIGGGSNTIATQSNYSSIIGGACNLLCGTSKYSSIIGGCCNMIATQSERSSIIGGSCNSVVENSYSSAILGGSSNTISNNGDCSVIIGGNQNTISNSDYTVISGGDMNNITDSNNSIISGGFINTIATQSSQSSIIGGCCNTLQYNSCNSSIIGGRCNTILESQWSSILGGANSCIDTTILGSVVGGESNIIDCVSARSVIMGSYISCISGTSQVSAIIAGKCNTINDLSLFTTIQGGYCNRICSSAQNSSILGGECNLICQNCNSSIVGGVCNTLTGTSSNSVILGGQGLSFSNVCDRVIVPTIILASASTERPHINFVSGASVSSPQNGDVWFDGNNLYIRINGQTKQFNLT